MPDTEPCKFCGNDTEPREYFGAMVYVCGQCFRDLKRMTGDGS